MPSPEMLFAWYRRFMAQKHDETGKRKADHSHEAQRKTDETTGPVYLLWKRSPSYFSRTVAAGSVRGRRPVKRVPDGRFYMLRP